ncbi:hydantoinase/oxoprolinase family protein [Halorientalis pallida]|uniref:Hydantoinase/oxoprolinase family protein n=1 Tax=Halorientalis pallida TaxID=2479928 RepID=A0A498KVT1_9EURY|nr:hydantoinase/oxoprolinase family protein [Halorientalis pallida]RXK48628.1 hydantoinase/oxoprolinase family protein [Halorientalis pallida]
MAGDEPVVRLGVDVGGTFTDVVVLVGGERTTAKVPTTDDQSRGVLDGIETACEAAGVDPDDVGQFRHATTVAVNALLEGAGAPTALVTTAGFRDVLAIGRQDRPALYDLDAEPPTPLVPREHRFEIEERATLEGIERPVDDDRVRELATEIEVSDAESVAVSLLHAYASPENERTVADILEAELDCPVSASHEVLGTFREYERTATTAAEAVVTPTVDTYLGRLTERVRDRGLPEPRVMQGNGGIADAGAVRDHAATTILSGPAAGVVGAAEFGDRTDTAGLVTFDMGGTSSDVSLVRDGDAERTTDADVGGHPVRVPMVDVNTVGAGGGSVAWVDAGGALRVGPRSTGAEPGPACYGKGGTEPTVTDANLVLGYLGPDTELGEGLALDAAAAESTLADLADEAGLESAQAAARGVYRVANATMSRAVRGVTVERGHDPRGFALAAFGGAGPMHAAALADRLGIAAVVVPPAEGVLSALGLLAADEKHDAARTHRTPLCDADPGTIDAIYDDLSESVLDDTADSDRATVDREADCRYAGQSFELGVDVPAPFDPGTVAERFHAAHERARGYRMDDEPVTLVTCRATATVPGDPPTLTHDPAGGPRTGEREAIFPDGEDALVRETPVYDRDRLPTDGTYDGPAIFEGGESTVVLPPDWTASVAGDGSLLLEVDR